MAVDYNTAVGGMANDLALLNVIRAKNGLPLHYTTIGRLSASATMRAGAGVNNQFRDPAATDLESLTTTDAPAGVTTAQVLSRSVLGGGDILTPTLSSELNTGPSFEITILDSQKFYQGILGSVPFTTVETYLHQGYDPDLIMRLFVEAVVYRAKEDQGTYKKGDVVHVLRNAPSGKDSTAFLTAFACYSLAANSVPGTPTPIAPLSRVASADPEDPTRFSLEDLARFDGRTLGLRGAMTANHDDDDEVIVVRPGGDRRGPQLVRDRTCRPLVSLTGVSTSTNERPFLPPSEPLFVGNSQIELNIDNKNVVVDATVELIFRSPEGVIRYVGGYLAGTETDPGETYQLSDGPLFSVRSGSMPGAAATARLLGQTYSLPADETLRRNGQVLAIIQQLVNLQKESSDRPTTIPFQLIP